MRITEAYTELRLTGAEVRLKNRSFKYDAVIGIDDKGLPSLSFYDLKTGETTPAGDMEYRDITAMLQNDAWDRIRQVKAQTA